jgi:1-deoxy-D-xylulose-5-phosphate synthase
VFDLAYMREIPRMTVMAPADEAELRDMLVTALTLDGPSSLRYPRGEGEGVELAREPEALPVGKAEVMREGDDVAILAVGPMAHRAMEAAETLADEGIEATVVNARFVKPMDEELFRELAEKTGALVTVEEGILEGGFGSAVAAMLADAGMTSVSLRRIGIGDEFVPAGNTDILLDRWNLNAEGIAETVREICG